MYTTISGIYENGQVTLQETAPTQNRANVLVVFMEEGQQVPQDSIPQPNRQLTRRFSERWLGQFNLKAGSDDARLDYLKQRYQL